MYFGAAVGVNTVDRSRRRLSQLVTMLRACEWPHGSSDGRLPGAAAELVGFGACGAGVHRHERVNDVARRLYPPPSSWAAATPVYCSAAGLPRPGVGSNGTQPTPAK